MSSLCTLVSKGSLELHEHDSEAESNDGDDCSDSLPVGADLDGGTFGDIGSIGGIGADSVKDTNRTDGAAPPPSDRPGGVIDGMHSVEATDDQAMQYTIGWICELGPEYEAAICAVNQDVIKMTRPGDDNKYHGGRIGLHRVVVASQHTMKADSASELTFQMVTSFRGIRDLLVVGVCSGVTRYWKNACLRNIVLGDVVVSASDRANRSLPVFESEEADVDAGWKTCTVANKHKVPSDTMRIAVDAFLSRDGRSGQSPQPLESALVAEVQRSIRLHPPTEPNRIPFKGWDPGPEWDHLVHDYREHINFTLPCNPGCIVQSTLRADRGTGARRQPNTPLVHFGPILTAPEYQGTVESRDWLMDRGFLAVEMESLGVASFRPTLTIRGISDYGDSHHIHGDAWLDYAAVNAATMAKHLISMMPAHPGGDRGGTRFLPHCRRQLGPIQPSIAVSPRQTPDEAGGDLPAASPPVEPTVPRYKQALVTHHWVVDMPALCSPYVAHFAVDRILVDFDRWSGLFWLNASSAELLAKEIRSTHNYLVTRRLITYASPPVQAQDEEQQANTASRELLGWLSAQERPWLIVLDKLGEEGGLDESLQTLLTLLLTATNGRLIVTARQVPDGWQGGTYNVGRMDIDTALELTRGLLPRPGPMTLSEDRALHELFDLVNFLPAAILFACGYVKRNGVNFQEYVRRWKEAYIAQGQDEDDPQTSDGPLQCTMQLSYTMIEELELNPPDLCIADMLNMLACFHPSGVSAMMFREAWRSTTFATWQSRTKYPETKVRGFWEIHNKCMSSKPGYQTRELDPEAERRPLPTRTASDENWPRSDCQLQVYAALVCLTEYGFLSFWNDAENSDIKMSPIVYRWIHERASLPGVAQACIRRGWRDAAFTIAASLENTLSPVEASWGPVAPRHRVDTSGCRKAAIHIAHLCDLSDRLDRTVAEHERERASTPPPNNPEVTFESSWPGVVWDLDSRGVAARCFDDVLSEHGFNELALQLRREGERLEGEIMIPSSLEHLAIRLTVADNLAADARHDQAFSARQAIVKDLPALRIRDPESGDLLSPDAYSLTFLRLSIRREMVENLWRVGRRAQSKELLDEIVHEFDLLQSTIAVVDSVPGGDGSGGGGGGGSGEDGSGGGLGGCNAFRIFKVDLALDLAEHRQRAAHQYGEANRHVRDIMTSLNSISPHLQDKAWMQRSMRARSLDAKLKSSRGDLGDALRARKLILDELFHMDPALRCMDTLAAQVAYAESLSTLGRHEESIKLLLVVDRRLRIIDSNSEFSMDHEVIDEARQCLAQAYLNQTDSILRRDPCSDMAVFRTRALFRDAVQLAEQVWWRCRSRPWLVSPDRRSYADPDCLENFTFFLHCEIRAKKGGLIRPVPGFSEAALQTSQEVVSYRQMRRDAAVTNAFFKLMVVSICLREPFYIRQCLFRCMRHGLLRPSLWGNSDWMDARKLAELAYDYHYAQYFLRPLIKCPLKRYRPILTLRPQTHWAARELERVWDETENILGPKSPGTLYVLKSLAEAYERMGAPVVVDRRQVLYDLTRASFGEMSARARAAAQALAASQITWGGGA
ncbi:hypothetical protein ACHAQA_009246 [Verticillium albo-atrum]